MFEVKVYIVHAGMQIPVTIATFEGRDEVPNFSRGRAIRFAQQIDKGFAVDVVDVTEENVAPTFGLVFHRDAEF